MNAGHGKCHKSMCLSIALYIIPVVYVIYDRTIVFITHQLPATILRTTLISKGLSQLKYYHDPLSYACTEGINYVS